MTFLKVFILYIIILLSLPAVYCQPVNNDTTFNTSTNNSLNPTSQKLVKSISDNKNDEEIAEDYYKLALELIRKGEYVKAETYLIRSIQLVASKKKNTRAAHYYRELAKVQELMKKTVEASDNYQRAADLSKDKTQQTINANDAERMRNPSNPELELELLNQNAQALSNSNDRKERALNYTQMANTNRALNQPEQALENYRNALNDIDSNSNEALNVKSDIATILAQTNNYEEAVELQKEVVEQSQKTADVATQTQQMRNLSNIYFSVNSTAEGVKLLKDAYELAVKKGNVKEAKASLISLVQFYEKNNKSQEALSIYKDFINTLDTLISKDSSLVDIKLFEITEEKIKQLEKEKLLNDELIKRKNKYNLMLVLSVFLLFALLILIIKGWFSIRRKNKRIALQSLRREMNPHFIFNSLNSINQFIAENNELEANKYLTSYSDLMRKMMENSNEDYVILHTEIEQLKKYLDLEKMRFPNAFDYELIVDPSLDTETVSVPNMIIQPNLENAIWHGLRYKDKKGLLKIKFYKENNKIVVDIDDNGIGLKESQNIKTKNQKLHVSRGLKNVQERIRLLNMLYKKNISFEITEKQNPETGTKVSIKW